MNYYTLKGANANKFFKLNLKDESYFDWEYVKNKAVEIMNNINDADNTILIVGYCEPNSLGGKLMAGNKEVRIFGEYFKVKAEVGVMRSMSAHGDYDDLCQYLSCQVPSLVKQVFVVHGEEDVQLEFQKRLVKKGYKDVVVPRMHQTFDLY